MRKGRRERIEKGSRERIDVYCVTRITHLYYTLISEVNL